MTVKCFPQEIKLFIDLPTLETSCTLVPEAIYTGSEERSESPLVESFGNLTSMLSQVQKLKLNDDWLTVWLSMEVRFPTDSTRGDSLRSSLRSSINPLWNQGRLLAVIQCFQ